MYFIHTCRITRSRRCRGRRRGTQDAQAAREAEDARREAEALRRDREKAERAEAKEADRARRDLEKADRDAAQGRRAPRSATPTSDVRDRREGRARGPRSAASARRRDAAREAARQLREAESAERAAALAQQQAAREAEKARRQAVRVARRPRRRRRRPGPADLPPGIAVLWRTPAAGRPGPRPGLSLEQIADAGIALADAEGIDAVSMARLAESLGFTTMSLYRYVSSKDEVLSLMSDRAAGRPPGRRPGGRRLARAARARSSPSSSRSCARTRGSRARRTVLHAVGPGRLAWMEAMLVRAGRHPAVRAAEGRRDRRCSPRTRWTSCGSARS